MAVAALEQLARRTGFDSPEFADALVQLESKRWSKHEVSDEHCRELLGWMVERAINAEVPPTSDLRAAWQTPLAPVRVGHEIWSVASKKDYELLIDESGVAFSPHHARASWKAGWAARSKRCGAGRRGAPAFPPC